MRKLNPWLFRSLLAAAMCIATGSAAQAQTRYLVTNDDVVFPFSTGVSFFTIANSGALTLQQEVLTGGHGIGGGYFGANRVVSYSDSSQKCVYASEANDGDIVGISVDTLTVGGSATGSSTDAGTSNGIGLNIQGGYLYATFTDSNTIGTFKIESGCTLMFINDTSALGLNSGVINAMASHGHMLIASYTDGSIQSFDISNGTPISNGDEQISTATVKSGDSTFPNQIEITRDGHYAIFGDTSTAVVLEVSDISSGALSKTVMYKSTESISSSTIKLSPDENILYVVNTQGDSVSAYYFDRKTGVLTHGCKSDPIRGQSSAWSYLAGVALIDQTGSGGGVYVAEFSGASAIAMVRFKQTGGACIMKEALDSPFSDVNSMGLLSIGTYPPPSF